MAIYQCKNRKNGCYFNGSSLVAQRNHQRHCKFESVESRIQSGIKRSAMHMGTAEDPNNISYRGSSNIEPHAKRTKNLQFDVCEGEDSNKSLHESDKENEDSPEASEMTTELSFAYNDAFHVSTQSIHATDYKRVQTGERPEEIQDAKQLLTSLAVSFHNIARRAGAEQVSDLIKLLNNESLRVEDLRDFIPCLKSCHNVVDDIVNTELEESGFERTQIADEVGNSCIYYKRSIIEVIRRQVLCLKREQVLCTPDEACKNIPKHMREQEFATHPMGSFLGIEGSKAIKQKVQSCSDPGTIWHGVSSMTPSMPAILQLYSDKSNMTLKSSAFSFYPLHAVLLNAEEGQRKRLIVTGKTIVGYLPCSFNSPSKEGDSVSLGFGMTRKARISILHKCLQSMTEELNMFGLQGFQAQTSDGKSLLLHTAIGSYIADIPEAKDMLGVFHGNRSMRNCFRCLIRSSKMSTPYVGDKRSLERTEMCLSTRERLLSNLDTVHEIDVDDAKRLTEEADDILSDNSIENYLPALSRMLYSDVPCFDPYRVFHFEPLHVLHLGITKMLLTALIERVKYKVTRPSKVFNCSNAFLREVEQLYKCSELHVDFSKSGKGASYNGLFTSDGVIGMLEARNYRHLEKVFPFLGAISDRFLNEIETAPTTTVFTLYSSLVQLIYRTGHDSSWNIQNVRKIQCAIRKFKRSAVSLFKDFQKSGMNTEKFHLLEHLPEDLYHLGSIQSMNAGLFEHTHVHFKSIYRTTSKRAGEATEVCVNRTSEKLALNDWMANNEILKDMRSSKKKAFIPYKPKECSTVTNASNKDTTTVSKPKLFENATDILQFVHFESTEQAQKAISCNKKGSLVVELLHELGFDDMKVLATELRDIIQEKGWLDAAKSLRIGRSSSAHVSSVPAPVLNDIYGAEKEHPHVHMDHSQERFLYRLVSARNYRNSVGIRQDAVILRTNECVECDENKKCVWFGVLKVLLTVRNPKASSQIEDISLAFVQFFEVVNTKDEVDKVLGCVKLRWGRGFEGNPSCTPASQILDPGKWFSLTPAASIMGMLPIVPAISKDRYAAISAHNSEKEQTHTGTPWYDQQFYINRYYQHPGDSFMSTED